MKLGIINSKLIFYALFSVLAPTLKSGPGTDDYSSRKKFHPTKHSGVSKSLPNISGSEKVIPHINNDFPQAVKSYRL